MKKIKRTLALGASLLAISTSGASAQDRVAVKIAYVPAVHFLPAFVAKETGCFEKAELDAEMVLIPVATNIPPALLADSVQIGMSTPSVMLPAVANGLELVAVAGSSRQIQGNESISLVTQPDLTISSAKDLVGKKVGVPGILSTGDLFFRKWLSNNGVSSDEVTYVEAPFARMMEMMSSKTVDAVLPAEPARSALVARKLGQRAPMEYYTEVAPDTLQTFWMSTKAWADGHKPQIVSFKTCLDESIGWIAANAAEAKKIEEKYLKVTTPTYPDWATVIKPDDFEIHQALAIEFGLLSEGIDTSTLFAAK